MSTSKNLVAGKQVLAPTIHVSQGCDGGRRHTVEVAEDPILEDRRQDNREGGNKQQDEVLLRREAEVMGDTIKQDSPAFWAVESHKDVGKEDDGKGLGAIA